MSIGLFKRPYVIRHFLPQTFVRGYATSSSQDTTARLNVQPLSANELQALPEGERTVRRVKSFGQERLISADEFTGTQGDRLFYQGYWYECKSSVEWNHTMLRHYRSEFVICKEQQAPPEVKLK